MELLQIAAALLVDRDGSAPKAILDAIVRSTSFLSAVTGENDPVPRYGDDDHGFALRLGPETEPTVRDHLE